MAGKQFQLISLGIAATHAPHAKSTVKWASTAAWHEMSQDSRRRRGHMRYTPLCAAQSVSFCMPHPQAWQI